MAKAVPVNSEKTEDQAPEKTEDQAPEKVVAASDFKVEGGAPVGSHKAIREDF